MTRSFTLQLRNGTALDIKAYVYGVLAVHKCPFQKGAWQLTHMPTSGTLAFGATKKTLVEIAEEVNTYAQKHMLQWELNDSSRIWFSTSENDHSNHRETIKQICKRNGL